MTNVAALKARNAERWQHMVIKPSLMPAFQRTAIRLCETTAKERYQGVADRMAEMKAAGQNIHVVPWWFTAIVSEREYGGPPHWDKQLGQGDPLHRPSTHDPKGRGPFLDHPDDVTPGHDAWTRAALDALIDCAPHAANWSDWSIGGVMTLFEEYNGLGYAARGVPSAYVWSGSNQYVSGKFVADHVYRANVVDVQEGCAPLLACMMAIDNSISFSEAA